MESKVCSRSQGHPPGPRNRAMIETARSNRSPVVADIAPTLNERRKNGQRDMGTKFGFVCPALVHNGTSTYAWTPAIRVRGDYRAATMLCHPRHRLCHGNVSGR